MSGLISTVYSWLSMSCLPEGTPDALRAGCRVLMPLTLLMWAGLFSAGWAMPDWLRFEVGLTALGALVVLTVCFVATVRYRREMLALAEFSSRLLSVSRPPRPTQTEPLHRVA